MLTREASELWAAMRPFILSALEHLNEQEFDDAVTALNSAGSLHSRSRLSANDADDLLRDLFALEKYLAFVNSYCATWQQILAGDFAISWSTLQDAFDHLRLVKKFSELDIAFFERQLFELESAYPYKVFASIGAIVDRFECSICGEDIDGSECGHRVGELYRGELAVGIAAGELKLDHVSLVLNPEDKRCVMTLTDRPQRFYLLNYMRNHLQARTLYPLTFDRIEWSKETVPNPSRQFQRPNERCHCGSGRRFKSCCGGRMVERDHAKVVASPFDLTLIVV